MADTFETEKFEDRKSQNLGFIDYGKKTLFWGLLPFAAGGVTLLTGKLTNFKLKPVLDGSPTIIAKGLNTLWESMFSKVTRQTLSEEEKVLMYDGYLFHTPQLFAKENQAVARKHLWNFTKGLEVGTIPAVYHFWKEKEGERLDLVPAFDRLKKLNDLKPTDADLAAENASLQKQLEFVQRRIALPQEASPILSTAEAQHEGKVSGSLALERGA